MHRLSLLLLLLLLGSATLHAQQEPACTELVNSALAIVEDACKDLERNTVCYGFNSVDATFLRQMADDFFSRPADRAGLTDLQSLYTTPLSLDANEWGIALMNIQANIPNSLPGQGLIVLLIGDTGLENAVRPEEAFEPGNAIEVITQAAGSNLRIAPKSSAKILTSVRRNTVLLADGISQDGDWVRVVYQEQPAWVLRILLQDTPALNELPTLSGIERTPMQAFRLTTGLGVPACSEVPNSLVIQGPNSMEVVFDANSADIVVGSTIMLRQPSANSLQLITIQGYARVSGITVPNGFSIQAALDEAGAVIPGSWSGFRPLSVNELNSLDFLRRISPELLHYPIQPPTLTEITAYQTAFSDAYRRCSSSGRSAEDCMMEEQCRNLGYTSIGECQQGLSANSASNTDSLRQTLDAIYSRNTSSSLEGPSLPNYLLRCQAAGVTTEQCQYVFSVENSLIPWPTRCSNVGITPAQCTILQG